TSLYCKLDTAIKVRSISVLLSAFYVEIDDFGEKLVEQVTIVEIVLEQPFMSRGWCFTGHVLVVGQIGRVFWNTEEIP
ncbi:hypothetical protein AB9F45_39425, partial [Rhizobium leguminosarum]|uniref:hypothetical protein n=1 Tax=Rhizobium leguminosarum TaxID=384 RepID=UPI003F973680